MNYFHSLYNEISNDHKKYNTDWADSSLCQIERDDFFKLEKTDVVHFVMDSEYVNHFILNYKSSTRGNQYFLIFSNSHIQFLDRKLLRSEFCHIAQTQLINGTIVLDGKSTNIIRRSKIIVIHYLFWFYPSIIKKINRTASIWWEVWGGDYLPYLIDEYIDPINMEVASYYDIDLSIFNPKQSKTSLELLAFIKNDVDYYFGFKLDYDLFKAKYDIRATFVETTIPNPTGFENVLSNKKEDRFIIGNSFNPTNNHFSAILFLSQSGYNGNVYIISSYGYSNKKYRESLEDFARSAFGSKVFFVDQYMKSIDYQRFMSNSQAVLFNHIRSQGSSTALTAIYNETNLYMREDSFLAKQYIEMCKNVVEIKDLISTYGTTVNLNSRFTYKDLHLFKLFFKEKSIISKCLSNGHF